MRRRKHETKELRERIAKLYDDSNGFSFAEIADIVKLKSRQLVRYHYLKYKAAGK